MTANRIDSVWHRPTINMTSKMDKRLTLDTRVLLAIAPSGTKPTPEQVVGGVAPSRNTTRAITSESYHGNVQVPRSSSPLTLPKSELETDGYHNSTQKVDQASLVSDVKSPVSDYSDTFESMLSGSDIHTRNHSLTPFDRQGFRKSSVDEEALARLRECLAEELVVVPSHSDLFNIPERESNDDGNLSSSNVSDGTSGTGDVFCRSRNEPHGASSERLVNKATRSLASSTDKLKTTASSPLISSECLTASQSSSNDVASSTGAGALKKFHSAHDVSEVATTTSTERPSTPPKYKRGMRRLSIKLSFSEKTSTNSSTIPSPVETTKEGPPDSRQSTREMLGLFRKISSRSTGKSRRPSIIGPSSRAITVTPETENTQVGTATSTENGYIQDYTSPVVTETPVPPAQQYPREVMNMIFKVMPTPAYRAIQRTPTGSPAHPLNIQAVEGPAIPRRRLTDQSLYSEEFGAGRATPIQRIQSIPEDEKVQPVSTSETPPVTVHRGTTTPRTVSSRSSLRSYDDLIKCIEDNLELVRNTSAQGHPSTIIQDV